MKHLLDGLQCIAEAIEVAFPKTTVQTCIVHLICNSLDYASWKGRKATTTALTPPSLASRPGLSSVAD